MLVLSYCVVSMERRILLLKSISIILSCFYGIKIGGGKHDMSNTCLDNKSNTAYL